MKNYILCKIFATTILLLFIYINVNAQQLNTNAVEKGVRGITNVASSIVSDSFTPMTHYNEGELTITGVPAYFNIKQLFDDPDISGDDLHGWSISLGGGYALSEKLMVYGIFSYMGMTGKIEGNFYGGLLPEVEANTDYNIVSFLSGVGYDFLGGSDIISIPIYAGLSLMRYGFDMRFPTIEYLTGPSYYADISLSDAGYMVGFTLGIAVSVKLFDCFKVTPYFLYMRSFNKPSVSLEISLTGPPIPYSYEESLSMGNVNAGMFGLSLTMESGKNLSYSLSTGGLLSSSTGFYNETFLNGLNMISIVFSVTYRYGNNQE